MDTLINIIFEHASIAHFIAFGALILAGCHIPISEDIVILITGIIAFTIIPENIYKICIAIFLGCFLSDSISYWTGRLFGRKMWNLKWFNKLVHPKRLIQAEEYFKKHGIKTLIFGRFIPFGVRHTLCLTAGIGKMRYRKFLMVDAFACALTNTTLLSIAYHLGKNHETIFQWLKTYNLLVFSIFITTIIFIIIFYKRRKSRLKVLQK